MRRTRALLALLLALPALLALLALPALPGPATAAAQEVGGAGREGEPPGLALPVVVDTLENGLRVLALHRPGAPTVSFVLRFEVGALDEGAGETGLSHLVEHLRFKGTTTVGTTSLADELALFPLMDAAHDSLLAVRDGRLSVGLRPRLRRRIEVLEDSARGFVVPSAYDRILTEQGARDVNASTDYEATTYFARLPANRAELWFVLEADRWANPVFREFYAERDVVLEERRSRVDASPGGRLTEELYATAFRRHPYGRPLIGWADDLAAHSRADARSWHDRWYRPGNAVLAVVGDIPPGRVLAWARRYLGPIPAGPAPVRAVPREPDQDGERRVRVLFDAEPDLAVAWRVPGGDHPDAPALEVLAQLLAGGRTSRLHRRMVLRDPMATAVSASVGPGYPGPRLFTVAAQPMAGHDPGDLEAAMDDEIRRLLRDPPTPGEIERVRLRIQAGDVRRLTSNLGLAFQLAESAARHGDWRETFRSGDALRAVTADDVVRVARTWLVDARRTVAVLTRPAPEPEPEREPGQGEAQ